MFELQDLPKFFLAFFLVLPIISFLHESGHVFFAWLMGAKNIKVTIGSGNVILRVGMVEVRKYYFWYGQCTFDNLRRNNRLANILVFAGGSFFNAIGALVIIYLIEHNHLEAGMLTYQFTYFSLYYIFFAMLPMLYPDGNKSDGKIILDLIRNKESPGGNFFKVQWDEGAQQWCVLNRDGECLYKHEDEAQALENARAAAQQNRPSRLVKSREGKEEEVENYPRVPL
ncbi:site-2 protease family protein [Pontibacter sp. CAU 1760]